MAAYRRVHDLTVTCGLTACTPGSAPGPTLGVEYGKALSLPFTFLMSDNFTGERSRCHACKRNAAAAAIASTGGDAVLVMLVSNAITSHASSVARGSVNFSGPLTTHLSRPLNG